MRIWVFMNVKTKFCMFALLPQKLIRSWHHFVFCCIACKLISLSLSLLFRRVLGLWSNVQDQYLTGGVSQIGQAIKIYAAQVRLLCLRYLAAKKVRKRMITAATASASIS